MSSNRIAATIPTQRLTTLAVASVLALATAAGVSQLAQAQEDDPILDISSASSELGTFLIDGSGATLYYFSDDVTPGVSECVPACLSAWPALVVAEGLFPVGDESITGTLAFTVREDGTRQATYRGRPLYTFVGDQAPGDTTGQNVADAWFVAAVDGSLPNTVVPPAPEFTLEALTTDLGTFITGADGFSTYYFAVDSSPGVSLCASDCQQVWPPVTVSGEGGVAAGEGVPGVIGTITTDDGSTQVTYDGRPLYYFASDLAAGDTNGQGASDIWWVATVDGKLPG